MARIFNLDGILTGLIDHYCLVCEVYLQNETEISGHTKTASHMANFASTCPYYKKCSKDDRIRKVKHGYYCEVCNVYMRTANNVTLHVTDEKHNDKKVSLVKRVDNTIVDKYGKVIAMENWHGLIDGTCVLCDTEYDDKSAHTQEKDHLLNLVSKTVEFHSVDNIYRKLDEKTSHCIICNDVVFFDKISAHNVLDKHLSNSKRETYNKSDVDVPSTTHSVRDQQEVNKKENVPSPGNISASKEFQCSNSERVDRKQGIIDSLEQFQKCSMNINFETETAVCKKCNKNVEFECESIKNHIDNHKDVKLVVDTAIETQDTTDNGDSQDKMDEASGFTVEDPKTYAEDNFITRNHYNKDAYCRLCDTRLASSLKCMKEHVNGAGHKKKLANKKIVDSSMKTDNKENPNSTTFTGKRAIVKQMSELFFKHIGFIDIEGNDNHIIVNQKFLIDPQSFAFILLRNNNYGYKCHSCEVILTGMVDLYLHLKCKAHVESIRRASVIITYENEFIRECRPGIYHCGYCNLLKNSIVSLEKHLKSLSHLDLRRSAEQHLSEILNAIRLAELLQQRHLLTETLLNGSLFNRRMNNRFDDSDSD